MTTRAANFGDRVLDLSVDSVQLKARKGETILYEQQFFDDIVYFKGGAIDYDNSTALDISAWTFNASIKDGVLSSNFAMDTKKYGPKGIATNSSYILSFDTSVLTTRIRANSDKDFYFEVQADIPTAQVDSEGNQIIDTQTVLVGTLFLTSDIYTPVVTEENN